MTELANGSSGRSLERKTAALLTFLALEGATSRSKLAGLLWPESGEKTARNNLAQVIRRLRAQTGESLVLGSDLLSVSPALEVDAARLKLAMFGGDYETVVARRGALLASYDYDDLPDFSDWLYGERERLDELQRQALFGEVARLEAEGAFATALEHVQRLLELDAVAEETHRLAMRLHYLAGDRAAALRAFKRCEEILRRELGVRPLPETLELARELERGRVVPPPKRPRPSIPLSVLRPPVLVGREREWARMEAAWDAGQTILLSGTPGSGKTRLMMDFVRSKGSYLLSEGRPGDAAVPLLSLARGYRRFFARFPEVSLEPWMRSELARLLPDLMGEQPPPETPEGSLRFHEAVYKMQRLIGASFNTVVTDDLQFYDPSSFDAAARATARQASEGPGNGGRAVACFRTGELPDAFVAGLEAMVVQGLAVHIELTPLPAQAVSELLKGLELEALPDGAARDLAHDLHRYTGGNPLFVIETVKNLLEAGQLGSRLPAGLPPTGRVSALISERLARLSPGALHLAWAAAVAQSDFSLELASAALERAAFDLAEPWSELARAQVFAENWFSHDLLYEATLAAIPAPIKALLHRRCADHLQAQGGNPARVAQHLLDAGDARRALPLLREAGKAAQAAYQLTAALAFFRRAAEVAASQGDDSAAFAALLESVMIGIDSGAENGLEAMVEELERRARTLAERVQACHARASLLYAQGKGQESERAARAGLELAARDDLRAELLTNLGGALYLQGKIAAAAETMQEAAGLYEALGERQALASALSDVAVMLDLLDRYAEAARYYHRADALARELGDVGGRIVILNNYGFSLRESGRARASLAPLTEAKGLLATTNGAFEEERRNAGQLGESHARLGHYALALAHLHEALELSQKHGLPHAFLNLSLADVYDALGAFDEAEAQIEAALAHPTLRERLQGVAWLARARLRAARCEDPRDALARAATLLGSSESPSTRVSLLVTRALVEPSGVSCAQDALELAHEHTLEALAIPAHTRLAQRLLTLDPGGALEHATAAAQLLERLDPADVSPAEVHFARYQGLAAFGDPGANEALLAALRWVREVAHAHCPPRYRESFVTRNPVNRAILGAAKARGLPWF